MSVCVPASALAVEPIPDLLWSTYDLDVSDLDLEELFGDLTSDPAVGGSASVSSSRSPPGSSVQSAPAHRDAQDIRTASAPDTDKQKTYW